MRVRFTKYTEETVLQEAEMFLNGCTIPEIGRTLNIPKSTVSWHLIKPLAAIDMDIYIKVRERLNKYAKSEVRFNRDLALISIYYKHHPIIKPAYIPCEIQVIPAPASSGGNTQ